MAKIGDLLARTKKKEAPNFDPAEKLRSLAEGGSTDEGVALEVGENYISCITEAGLELYCQVESRYNLVFTTGVGDCSEGVHPELAEFLLDLNSFSINTGGGWLSLDKETKQILFHFRWSEFSIGNKGLFLTVTGMVLDFAQEIRGQILGENWNVN